MNCEKCGRELVLHENLDIYHIDSDMVVIYVNCDGCGEGYFVEYRFENIEHDIL
ncbi:MAG: hypothetical protein ACOC1K_07170 [Nanoarchaeota archaeon]